VFRLEKLAFMGAVGQHVNHPGRVIAMVASQITLESVIAG
jgi:hypothetical protein